jgi:hypothetical protein
VASHTSLGRLEWGGYNVELIQDSAQSAASIRGDVLQRMLKHRRLLNATVLDYLVAYQEMIPEGWECDAEGNPRFITFFGTLFASADSDTLWVKYMNKDPDSKRWEWGIVSLSEAWHGRHTYAAVLKQLARERANAVG